MLIAQVIVPNLSPLEYSIPNSLNIEVGNLVIVPFRSKKLLGLVIAISNKTNLPLEKLRSIENKLDLSLPELYIKLIIWVADYYCVNYGHIFRLILPHQIAEYLIKSKALLIGHELIHLTYTPPNFNKEQVEAIDKIAQLINNDNFNIMLDGVTGSGKTEIYLAAIYNIIKNNNGQALILLPEISLTSQIIDRVNLRFGIKPCIWHSNLTPKNKREIFNKIINGSARIVIGARSALFLPFKNLSTIIVDEEHEQAYKQEDGVTYHARDMAIIRAKIGQIPIMLASASPSLEAMHNSNIGKFNLIKLAERYNLNDMPKVEIIDMKKEKRKNLFISGTLLNALKENLNKNQQSLLFLNRKGYSPIVICSACGYQKNCYHCSTSMVYHKAKKMLKCHQCGEVAALPKLCPHCKQEDSFIPCGPGVERLAEEVNEHLPHAKVVILTQESFNKPKEAEQLLNDIRNNVYNIIIGTQIIAKGHHFPTLTLVGIIDADLGMMGGDLRTAEKTYQLLQQVGGRAGREIDNSKIFIQTFNPENPLIISLASYNRDQFITEEMQNRKILNMPPYGKLVAIILSSKQEQKLAEFAKYLVKIAPSSKQISIFGPAPALVYKIRGKYRYRILLKTARNINIQKFLQAWLQAVKTPSHIQLKIDIDPYHFL